MSDRRLIETVSEPIPTARKGRSAKYGGAGYPLELCELDRDPRLDRFDRHAGPRGRAAQPRPVQRRGARRGAPPRAPRRADPRVPAAARRHRRRGGRRGGQGRARARCAAWRSSPAPRPRRRLARESDADMVLNAMVGAVGLAPSLAALQSGQVAGAREQGVADRRRRADHGPGQGRARPADPGRLGALGARAVPARRAHARTSPRRHHRVGRAVPRVEPRGAGEGEREGGARAPHVEDGPEDHDRLGDADEQGPRGDRGALPVRAGLPARSTSSCTPSRSSTASSSSTTAA